MEGSKMIFPVVIHKDKTSDYGISFPDLVGCFSAGKTYEEALINAQEAALCHIEGLLLANEEIPKPSLVDDFIEDQQYHGGTWALVSVDLAKISGKSKRINVTIPENILSRVDLFAKNHGETRSALLSTAVMEYILNND